MQSAADALSDSVVRQYTNRPRQDAVRRAVADKGAMSKCLGDSSTRTVAKSVKGAV